MQPHSRRERFLCRPCAERIVVADGAMGTMLQAADLALDDFAGLEGCNEILNDTRPDVVRGIHRAYFEAGADAVETNTFGANLPNLAEYDIPERIRELAEKGTVLAREVADEMSHTGPAAVRARLGRPRHQAADAGPRVVRPPPRRLRRVRPRPASRAGPTRSSSRPARTSCRPRRPSWACAGRWPTRAAWCRSSRRSPSRPPARCCSAPRSAPRSPRWRRSASTSSG